MFKDNFDPVPGYFSIYISGEIILKHKCRKKREKCDGKLRAL